MDIASLSVVVSGIVAISGVTIPVVTEWLQWRRDQKVGAEETLAAAHADLLGAFSWLQTGDTVEAADKSDIQVTSEVLSRYYKWEYAVWQHLSADERKRVQELRLGVRNSAFQGQAEVIEQILQLTHLAQKRLS